MKWVIPLIALLVSGCIDGGADVNVDNEASAVDGDVSCPKGKLVDTTLANGFTNNGHESHPFKVAPGCHTMVIRLADDSTWAGDVHLRVVDANGNSRDMVNGIGASPPTGGYVNSGTLSNSFSMAPVPGDWAFVVEGAGQFRMHVKAELQ